MFIYLGVVFHCHSIGESAARARTSGGCFAVAVFDGRGAALGLEAARLLLILYQQMVDSTLSYAAAVWAPGTWRLTQLGALWQRRQRQPQQPLGG